MQTHHHHPIMNHVECWKHQSLTLVVPICTNTRISLPDMTASRKSKCTCNRACWKKCVSTNHGLILTRAILVAKTLFWFALLSLHGLATVDIRKYTSKKEKLEPVQVNTLMHSIHHIDLFTSDAI
jgi:hypothetical protein